MVCGRADTAGAWGAVSLPGLVRLSLRASYSSSVLGNFRSDFLSSSSSRSPMGRFPCFPITVAKSAGPAAALQTAFLAQSQHHFLGEISLAFTCLFSRALGSWRTGLACLLHHWIE